MSEIEAFSFLLQFIQFKSNKHKLRQNQNETHIQVITITKRRKILDAENQIKDIIKHKRCVTFQPTK